MKGEKGQMKIKDSLIKKTNQISSKDSANGITLVALVVTIVVLLILAGITVTMLFGDNGIINKAQQAANETKRDQEETEGGLANLTDQMLQALGEPITKKEHTKANLTATADVGDVKGLNYTWSELYNVSKAISKMTVPEDVREITVNVNGKNYTVGIGDEATVYYDGTTAKTVRLIGFNHDTVVDSSSYGASKAGMTFEFVDYLGNHNMNGTDSSTSTNADGWAATEMREYLNGYNSKTTDTTKVGVQGGEAAKIKDSNGNTLEIQKVKKDYIPTYNSATLSDTPSEDYLWLLSCAEIWSEGKKDTGRGYAMGIEGSQYEFYKDISDLKYNVGNDSIKKPSASSSKSWWLRSPDYFHDDFFCRVNAKRRG